MVDWARKYKVLFIVLYKLCIRFYLYIHIYIYSYIYTVYSKDQIWRFVVYLVVIPLVSFERWCTLQDVHHLSIVVQNLLVQPNKLYLVLWIKCNNRWNTNILRSALLIARFTRSHKHLEKIHQPRRIKDEHN